MGRADRVEQPEAAGPHGGDAAGEGRRADADGERGAAGHHAAPPETSDATVRGRGYPQAGRQVEPRPCPRKCAKRGAGENSCGGQIGSRLARGPSPVGWKALGIGLILAGSRYRRSHPDRRRSSGTIARKSVPVITWMPVPFKCPLLGQALLAALRSDDDGGVEHSHDQKRRPWVTLVWTSNPIVAAMAEPLVLPLQAAELFAVAGRGPVAAAAFVDVGLPDPVPDGGGSNSRATAFGDRPERTRSTICRRYCAGYCLRFFLGHRELLLARKIGRVHEIGATPVDSLLTCLSR